MVMSLSLVSTGLLRKVWYSDRQDLMEQKAKNVRAWLFSLRLCPEFQELYQAYVNRSSKELEKLKKNICSCF